MLFDGKRTEFESELHKTIWTMGRNIVPFDISAAEIMDRDTLDGFRQIYDFTIELFSDMYENPDRYELTDDVNGHKRIGNVKKCFHEFFFSLVRDKRIQPVGNDWEIKMADMPPRVLKGLKKLEMFTHLGICCETADGTTVIKSTRYPLFLKYFARLCEASIKRKFFSISYVVFCDFRVFGNYAMTIEDTARVLSDGDRALALEMHEHAVANGGSPILSTHDRENYPLFYKYDEYDLMRMCAWNSAYLGFTVYIGADQNDEKWKLLKLIIDEIEKLPNRNELLAYTAENLHYCNFCGGNRASSCHGSPWTDFYGEQRLICNFVIGRRYDIIYKYDDYDGKEISILKQLVELRAKAIDALRP